MEVGRAVRLFRVAQERSQKELASDIGCTANYVSMVERGDRTPSLGWIEAAARALGISTDDLLSLAGARDEEISDPTARRLAERLRRLSALLADIAEE